MSKFIELGSVNIQDKRKLVISYDTHKERLVIGQKILVDENGNKLGLFLKGAFHIDLDRVAEVQKVLDYAIAHLQDEDLI